MAIEVFTLERNKQLATTQFATVCHDSLEINIITDKPSLDS